MNLRELLQKADDIRREFDESFEEELLGVDINAFSCDHASCREIAEVLQDLIAELKRATEWKPIATAKKDGTGIQSWCPGYGVRELFWSEIEDQTGWRLVGAPLEGPYEPTHWRELPTGPDAELMTEEGP